MIGNVLEMADLQKVTGYKAPSDVARCLVDQGVPVFWGAQGPFTTMSALDSALAAAAARAATQASGAAA